MKVTLKHKLILVALVTLSFSKLSYAQYDPMFTQYMFNELFINPAYSGSHEALSLNGLHRQQWVGIEGRPVTTTFTGHMALANKKVGVGAALMNEKIGVTKRNTFSLDYAYRILMNKGVLSFGLQGTLMGITENLADVKTTTINDQRFSSNVKSGVLPNFGFGTYYATDKFYVGLSVPRILENKVDVSGTKFTNGFNISNFHYYLTTGYLFTITDNLKLKPSIMAKVANGSPLEGDFTLNSLWSNALWLGVAYRTNDAVSALIGYQFTPQFRFGYSYDYTLTALQKYNSGSHEINLSYLFSYKNQRIATPRFF